MARFLSSRKLIALGLAVLALLIAVSIPMLTNSPKGVTAAWPGGNGKIAFVSARNTINEIYVMDQDGNNQVRLTNNGLASDDEPHWSPNGTKIAFSSNRDGTTEVFVMDADGNNQTRLTMDEEVNRSPSWSPDGTKIAFISQRDGRDEIYIMNSDGTNQARLTNAVGAKLHPSWSPDGTSIAFSSYVMGNPDLYKVTVNGGAVMRLTMTNNTAEYSPEWSPDGTKIAYSGISDLFVMNANGSGQTNLTNNPASTGESGPSWSPDGARIVFSRLILSTGEVDIYTMATDGSDLIYLTGDVRGDFSPSWQRICPPMGCVYPPTATPCPPQGCPTATRTPSPTNTATVTPSWTPCPPASCPDLDFFVGVDYTGTGADECDTKAGNATCQMPAGTHIRVHGYLRSLGSVPAYDAAQIVIGYTGVASEEHPESVWPGCALDATKTSGSIEVASCAVGPGQASVPYVGLMATFDFTCSADGAITLSHGPYDTFVIDPDGVAQFEGGSDETLTIDCVPAAPYPTDTDGDGCPDMNEAQPSPMAGGQRNWLNPWDYFNPTHDHQNRIDDPLAVLNQYFIDEGEPGYTPDTDRTFIGPNPWGLGPPDGKQRIDDMLNALKQYYHDCS